MHELHKHWGSLLIRGIAAIIFGLVAFSLPGLTLSVLVYFFAVFFILDGIIVLLTGASVRSGEFLLEGLIDIGLGLLLFFLPTQTVSFFVFIVAFWAIITGLIEVLAAIRLRKHINNEFWLLLAGIVSLIFGVVVFANPLATAVVLTMFLGVYTLFFGVLLTALALRLRTHTPSKAKKRK